jgi:hypothetical protein
MRTGLRYDKSDRHRQWKAEGDWIWQEVFGTLQVGAAI